MPALSVEEIIKTITRDDMPNEDMREIYDDFGAEIAVKLIIGYGGVPVRPPKNGLVKYYSKRIRKEYDGRNANQLARKYKMTQLQIFRIMASSENDSDRGRNSVQMNLDL